jgi:tetratricopeptide (TPR) repeat protein
MRLRSMGTSGSISVLSLVCLSKTYAITGEFDRALSLAAEAQLIAEETRKPYDLTYGRVASGFAHILAGQPEAAVIDLSMALEQCRSGNIPILIPSVARYLGRAYALIGEVDAAHELLEESLENCRAQSMMALTIWCGLASGHAHIEGGTHDDASARLEHILRLARKHAYRPAEAHGWHLLARSRLAQGEIDAANAALLKAETMARQMGMVPELTALKETRLLFQPVVIQE